MTLDTPKKSDLMARIFLYALFAFFIFLIHIPWTYIGDDLRSLQVHSDQSVIDRFIYLYNMNGKIFTDILAFILCRIPLFVWKLLDTAVYVLIAVLLVQIFSRNTAMDVFAVCCLLLAFPFYYVATAGYICVSTNYIYTTLCLLLVAFMVKKVMSGDSLRSAEWIVSIVSILYSSSQDQSALCMIGMLLLFILFAWCQKFDARIFKPAIILLLLSIGFYVYMFLLPGHINRMTSTAEMESYLPEYATWSFAMKVYRGYSSTVAHIMFNGVSLFQYFCVLICLLAFSHKNLILKLIGFFPLLVQICIKLFGSHRLIYQAYDLIVDLNHFYSSLSGKFALAISVLILVCIITVIWHCVAEQKSKWLMFLLLTLAAGSREMMGFSPTIYASAERTFIYMIFAIIICCILILNDLKKSNHDTFYRAGIGAIIMLLI